MISHQEQKNIKCFRAISLLSLSYALIVSCSAAPQAQTQSSEELAREIESASRKLVLVENEALISKQLPRKNQQVVTTGSSDVESEKVLSPDGTLECSIQKWQVDEVKLVNAGDDQVISSEAFYSPKFKNLGEQARGNMVMIEFLATRKDGQPIPGEGGPQNPGIARLYDTVAPLQPDETKVFEDSWKFQQGWENLQVQNCDWLTSKQEFLEKYPYFETYQGP